MTKSELTKELVGKAKAGDKSAFGELYAEYSEQIKRFVMKMNITELDAEDIVADTFAEVMEHIEDLENDSAFSTWLHSIAKRKVYAKTGREQCHERVSFNSADDDMQNDELDILANEAADFNCDDSVKLPHDYAENEEIKQILADTVNELKPEHRDSIFMFYYENKSLNEIAEEMNVPVGTVKSRLNNGRKALSKKCEALIKKGYAFSFVPIPVLLGVLVKESKLKAAGAVTSTAAASTMAGGAASGAAVSAISGKIGAVIAAAVMIGAGTGVYFHYSRNADKIHKKPQLSDSSMVDSSKELPDSNNDWNPDLRKYQQREVRVVDEAESEVEVNETSEAETSSTADAQTPTGNTQTVQGGVNPALQEQTVYYYPDENDEADDEPVDNEPTYEELQQADIPNYYYNEQTDGSYMIYAYNQELGLDDITIPSEIDGHKITGIADDAFCECKNLKKVTVPEGITNFGYRAFVDCTSLESISLPSTLKELGNNSFQGCTSLKSIELPYGVTSIPLHSFSGCSSLTEVSIPNSVKHIGWFSFNDCTSLKEIVLPDSVEFVSADAFSGCTSLTNITISSSMERVVQYYFYDCPNLKNITIPESVDFIHEEAFENCSPDLTIKCKKGSYAETYAKEHNFNYEYY